MCCICTGLGLIPSPRKEKNNNNKKKKDPVKKMSKDTFLQMLTANEKNKYVDFI